MCSLQLYLLQYLLLYCAYTKYLFNVITFRFLIHLLPVVVCFCFLFLDLPQNCDPNIPLVAQELMKKMIRQFAIEYISKSSKIQENRNGSSFEPSLICKSIQMNQTENSLQDEQDSPLDLTVNRSQEQNTQQGKCLYLLICDLLLFITVPYSLKFRCVSVSILVCVVFPKSNRYIQKKVTYCS